jgi:hypothetical protein
MKSKDVRKVLQRKFLTKDGVMKLLKVKEYWLSEKEQEIIDDYRRGWNRNA